MTTKRIVISILLPIVFAFMCIGSAEAYYIRYKLENQVGWANTINSGNVGDTGFTQIVDLGYDFTVTVDRNTAADPPVYENPARFFTAETNIRNDGATEALVLQISETDFNLSPDPIPGISMESSGVVNFRDPVTMPMSVMLDLDNDLWADPGPAEITRSFIATETAVPRYDTLTTGGPFQPFSLTMELIFPVVEIGESVSSRLDVEVEIIPEPTTVMLLGMGLLLLGTALARSRKKK